MSESGCAQTRIIGPVEELELAATIRMLICLLIFVCFVFQLHQKLLKLAAWVLV
jgi:hypothetical protein